MAKLAALTTALLLYSPSDLAWGGLDLADLLSCQILESGHPSKSNTLPQHK